MKSDYQDNESCPLFLDYLLPPPVISGSIILNNCLIILLPAYFSLCIVCALLRFFSLPPLKCYLLSLIASCTSSFSLSPPSCLSTDFSCRIQQCIRRTSIINICSFYSITHYLFKHSSLHQCVLQKVYQACICWKGGCNMSFFKNSQRQILFQMEWENFCITF